MSTSGGTWLNAGLLLAAVVLSVQVGVMLTPGRRPAVTPVAAGLWLLVAVPSLVQFAFPALLTALRRDPELVRQHGQVWRVLTSVLVQDGGWPGALINLAALAVIGVVAADVWGPVLTPSIFLVSQLVFNTAAVLLSPDVGAGNSGATLGLGASLVGLAVLTRRETALRARAIGVLAVGVALVVIGDGHGIAVLGGVLIGLIGGFAGRPGADVWQTQGHHAEG